MPKIQLKPFSPEYLEDDTQLADHKCDMPGCPSGGEFRAPKNRGLQEYYHFCRDHIAEYNRAWDFFDGMNEREVEDHILKSMLWDIETRKFSDFKESDLRQKARDFYNGYEVPPEDAPNMFSPDRHTPEFEAMAIMGLQPPIDLDGIKKRYKQLAKKYHPDLNKNDPKAEDLLKSINMAYTILKLSYERHDHKQKETV